MAKPKLSEFDGYMEHLCEALGHADRCTGFVDYSRALMLPIERKSVEPLAAYTDPYHVSAKHQSLHHLVAKSAWSDAAVLARIEQWVRPALKLEEGCYWLVDDSSVPKKGKHSVGVSHQYCGQLGKQANCQVAVSLSLASPHGSLPIAWRLYCRRLGRRTASAAPERGCRRRFGSRRSRRLLCSRFGRRGSRALRSAWCWPMPLTATTAVFAKG